MLPKITGVMAATAEGIIGQGDHLPWSYPDEQEIFRARTRDAVVVMGRKTFEAIPQAFFAERTPIVFSRSRLLSARTARDVSGFLDLLSTHYQDRPVFMIGGGELASLFFKEKVLTDFILTRIHKPYAGDVRLDLWYLENWSEKMLSQTPDYTILHLLPPR